MSTKYPLAEPGESHGPVNTEIDPKRTQRVRQLYKTMGIMIDARRRGDVLSANSLRIYINTNAERLEKG
jgi:hypothetical protein